ncbi:MULTISPECIES: site-specific integrase [unclassified Methylibium]|uniref:tyrosine-type recombinase/integrase n=1 Tax=unclassified Methylibium TaxID=2633235 RepID=UPI0003F3F8C9|nr:MULTISPECIES: site-specific integrase [unclassified Methylibium]EWS53130.1 site-specific tyrosine recombinase XerC [Methylibium sp. T29]EWS57677.1 site-specific tyrosine recombinase XerC [Methylibium sp. T29-B]
MTVALSTGQVPAPKAARLVWTNEKFIYGHQPRPGFPIILGDDMKPLQPAHDFLLHLLLGRTRTTDEKTWDAYGRRLWDYFATLAQHGIPWDYCPDPQAPGKGPVAIYKGWSLKKDPSIGKTAVAVGTLNDRLRVVVAFYEWAHRKGLIEHLPFGYQERRVRHTDFLMHTRAADATRAQADVLDREWSAPPAYLSKEAIQGCLNSSKLRRHTAARLLFNLMWRVGLRSCEARTFPLSYVFNPATRSDCARGKLIRVQLNPSDMEIKFDKPREVHIPYSLMQDLWDYVKHERNHLASKSPTDHSVAILNQDGQPYNKDSVSEVMRAIGRDVSFKVSALSLRHSYAVHMLVFLREKAKEGKFDGEPLLYVRDRLGHEDVQTTLVYLEQINRLASEC